MKEKFYFVYQPCAGGYVIVAKSVKDARLKAYKKGLFPDCGYIDIRATLLRDGKDADYEFLKRFLEKDGICYPPECSECKEIMLMTFKEAEEKICKRCKEFQEKYEKADSLERLVLEETYFGGC